jgi:hypothetical protein
LKDIRDFIQGEVEFRKEKSRIKCGVRENSKRPNRPMHLTPMPSALLARRLRSRLWRQKQVGASDRGRSAEK